MKKKNALIIGFVFLGLFILFTVMLKTVDVGTATEVPQTDIGFSGINNYFHSITGVNMTLYDITDYMGIGSICFGLLFAVYGLYQLVSRKSLKKVDFSIYCLGGVYVLLGMIYAFFEKVIINYRPVIMPGKTAPEASFPSSHTLLTFVIAFTAIIEIKRIFANKKSIKNILSVFLSVYAVIAVIGRLLSGVHWLSDITASLLLGFSIIFFFIGISKNENGKHDFAPYE